MKQKRMFKMPYGLRNRFIISIIASVLLCSIIFAVLYFSVDSFLTRYFDRIGFEQTHIKWQGESLQEYIDENHVSSDDLESLKEWERRQPVILLELYDGENCIYSSFYESPMKSSHYENVIENLNNTVDLRLADGSVTAVLYSDFTYQYYLLGTGMSVLISLAVFIFLFLRGNNKLINYVCRLNDEVQIIEGGNLEYQVSVEGNNEITDLAKSMNRMRDAIKEQMDTEQQLHQANKQLITEMSHDLRTPLTGMMLYLEILRSHRYETEEELQAYLEKIDAKAHHMKLLSDHLFEYTLENAEHIPAKQAEPATMEQAFESPMGSLTDELNAHGFSVDAHLKWPTCFVQVKQEYLQRIFGNIASNIYKYGEPSADITIETIADDRYCGFSIMNVCTMPADRVESNGIGIESIRSMMQEMDGICTVEQTDTVFEMTLLFPKQ